MIKSGTIEYPKMFMEVAKDLALSRWLIDKEVRGSNSEYKRDNKERELEIETKGILGELIARYYLETDNIDYTSTALIAEKPLKEADIVIRKHRIDVKASNNQNTLMVNEKAHIKGKGKMDFYWFIVLNTVGHARYFLYSYDDVEKWEIKKMTYTNAYIKSI